MKIETTLPVGRILKIKVMPNGSYKVTQEVAEEVVSEPKAKTVSQSMVSDDDLILIEVESLSLNDEVMKYQPCTKREKELKALIAEAIEKKVKNFYRPKCDPSFTENGIQFVAGKKSAVGKSYNWWFDTAKKYAPSRNSRLGTRLEYGAFLGVLIKKLVEEVKSVEWAWDAVCNDSKELGHYWNSKNAKNTLEPTGSRLICGFYDLANICKILAEDVEFGGFWLAGGNYGIYGCSRPLAALTLCAKRDNVQCSSVGWLVLS